MDDQHPDDNINDELKLSLAINVNSNPIPPPPPLPSPLIPPILISSHLNSSPPPPPPRTNGPRSRRSSSSNNSNKNDSQTADQVPISETINPPFPWATDRPAGIHTLTHLISSGIVTVKGEEVCRRCNNRDSITYNLLAKFEELGAYVMTQAPAMHDRAPPEWLNPTFSDCARCGQTATMRPLLADRNEEINWLFLFLGQLLGVCTLEQLKWFCKHTGNHSTGAKNRVLYSSYIAICNLLQPRGVFEGLVVCDS